MFIFTEAIFEKSFLLKKNFAYLFAYLTSERLVQNASFDNKVIMYFSADVKKTISRCGEPSYLLFTYLNTLTNKRITY